MQKRIKLFFSATVLAATAAVSTASAQALYTEGKDYTVLENPLPLRKAGQEEVVEFFSYACPHCANLEPHIIKWKNEKKPEDVGFYQIPAVGGTWTFVAQVKYTADKLGLGDEFNQKYFTAIHTDKKRRLLGAKSAAIDFMVKEGGADKSEAEKAWSSLQVKSGLKNSAQLWVQAKLDAVPTVIVNGKYQVKLNQYDEFFAVIDFLLATTSVEPVVSSTDKKTAETTKVVTETATESKPAKTETKVEAVAQ